MIYIIFLIFDEYGEDSHDILMIVIVIVVLGLQLVYVLLFLSTNMPRSLICINKTNIPYLANSP